MPPSCPRHTTHSRRSPLLSPVPNEKRRGVSHRKDLNKWRAYGPADENGVQPNLHLHDTEEQAYQAVLAHLRERGLLEDE